MIGYEFRVCKKAGVQVGKNRKINKCEKCEWFFQQGGIY